MIGITLLTAGFGEDLKGVCLRGRPYFQYIDMARSLMRRLPAWLMGLVGLVLSFLIVSLFLFNSSQRPPNSTAAIAGAETPHSAVQTPRSTATIDDALNAYEASDYPTALRNFQRLANEGNLKAQKILGFVYHVGRGVPQDYAEALKWYRKAADQGD